MELKIADHTVEMIKAIISWPLIVFISIALFMVLFRVALTSVLLGLVGKANKLSLYGFSIELASDQRVAPIKLDASLTALQQPYPDNISSDAFSDLAIALQNEQDAQYLIIDVSPDNWLTSRLFLFSALLPLITNLSCLIFVDSSQGIPNRFIAQAKPADVACKLEQKYPWLATQLDNALGRQPAPQVSRAGPWEPLLLLNAAQLFVTDLRSNSSLGKEYVEIHPGVFERASWITRDNIAIVLKDSLITDYVRDDKSSPPNQLVAEALSLNLQWIPIVDLQMRFRGLLDRNALLASIADQMIEANRAESR